LHLSVRTPSSRSGSLWSLDKNKTWIVNPMTQTRANANFANAELKPSIFVSEADHDRLINLAVAAEERAPDVASALQSEMERARVVPAASLPAHVVQMGSTVEFHSDAGQQRRVTLVFPGEADLAKGRISILTPIGAALIGLSPGQSITWTARDGRQHRLTVLSVAPPEREPARAGELSGS
jgi:regulator of nucleoside diphosphate kinase